MDAFNQKCFSGWCIRPIYILCRDYGLLDSRLALIIIFYINELAYCGMDCFFPTSKNYQRNSRSRKNGRSYTLDEVVLKWFYAFLFGAISFNKHFVYRFFVELSILVHLI